ncbi:poliovirus receptor isoform 2-T2 [Hipposideros larvatus]
MARAASSAWPHLLLSLLSLSWTPTRADTETIVLRAPHQVRSFLGNNATLQCKLQTQNSNVQVTLVTWMRPDPTGRPVSIAVFHPTQGPSFPAHPSFPDPGRLEFVAARPGVELRDATLAVRELRAEDEANYTCHFATFPHGSRSAGTWLRVLAQPQNKAEIKEDPLSQEPVACCVSTGGRPPASISWSLGGEPNTSQAVGPLPGTFTVTSLLTLKPSSQINLKNVTCIVKHETYEKPVTLTVHYPPEVSISGYDGNWYLGQSEANLSCDAYSNPEPTAYEWTTIRGSLPSSAVPQGKWLMIHFMDESINTTFICSVTNALGIGKAEQTILLREGPPMKQSPGALSLKIIILIVVVVVVVLGVGGLLIYKFRHSFRISSS